MLMTRKEASFVECPIRSIAAREFSACCAHGCAMWRLVDPLRRRCRVPETPVPYAEPPLPAPPPPADLPVNYTWLPAMDAQDDTGVWIEPEQEANARRRGYCGLAGKPTEE